ncbi:MAG: LysR family transcriptional regulator [Kofleriaceae bacterium]
MDLLDQMRTFVRIVDGGSLSSAARGRRMSVAAVSRQLAALEAELAAPLIARSTRRREVPPRGRRWYEHCVRLLRELEAARDDVAESPEPRGTVTVSAPVALGIVYVVPRLERLARKYRRLELELRLEDHLVDLVGEAVDLALRIGPARPDSTAIVARPVFEFRRQAVASRAYLRRRGTPRHPRELAQHDGLIQLGAAPWRFVQGDEVHELAAPARLRSSAPIALRDWALAGAGIAFLPAWLVSDTDLVTVLPGWSTPAVHVWALQRVAQRAATRVRAVLDALGA